MCHGYGTRLSWPRESDTRRMILGPAPAERRRYVARHFVNASAWDLEMHDLISSTDFGRGTSKQHPNMRTLISRDLDSRPAEFIRVVQPILSPTIFWASGRLDPVQMDLFEYCQIPLSGPKYLFKTHTRQSYIMHPFPSWLLAMTR